MPSSFTAGSRSKGTDLSPIVGDNRRDLGFHKLTNAFNDRELLRRQGFVEIVEVTVGRGSGFRGLAPFAASGDAVVFVAVGVVL